MPSIAADEYGNAIAVWMQRSTAGPYFEAWANRFAPASELGSRWGAIGTRFDFGAPADPSSNVAAPQVAFDGSGNAVAVWTESNATTTGIFAKHFR
jgi:hypothetical protein